MALKTRLEILEKDHESALTQLIEKEINITLLTNETLVIKPGDEYNKIKSQISQHKEMSAKVQKVLKIIEDMIEVEKKGAK